MAHSEDPDHTAPDHTAPQEQRDLKKRTSFRQQKTTIFPNKQCDKSGSDIKCCVRPLQKSSDLPVQSLTGTIFSDCIFFI